MAGAKEGMGGGGFGRGNLARAIWQSRLPVAATSAAFAVAALAGVVSATPADLSGMAAVIGFPPLAEAGMIEIALPLVGLAAIGGLTLGMSCVLVRELASRCAPGSQAENRHSPSQPIRRRAPPISNAAILTPISDIAEAIGAAKISRIFLAGSAKANEGGAVALARHLARTGAATILVDFGQGANAVRRMGSLDGVERVATMAASPTSFAHAIQRDRQSAVHSLAADIEASDKDRPEMVEAVGTVLEALSLAYRRTVVVAGSLSSDELRALTDGNTAIIVPVMPSEEGMAIDATKQLSADGLAEIILMTLEEVEDQSVAA